MADWYVSSVAYAAIPVWAASTAYTVGQFVKPTAPAVNARYAFRVTTAGTSGTTEPSWPSGDNATVTNGGAVFTNVTGQSAYGWSAAAGSLLTFHNVSIRAAVGDRVFLSSDHVDNGFGSNYAFNWTTHAFGLIQIISVNRAGSVPPVAADIQAGASIIGTANTNLILDTYTDMFWQGITITVPGTGGHILFANSGMKSHYFKNCALALTNTGAGSRLSANDPVKVTLDNTTVRFGNAGQGIGGASNYIVDLTWLNTPAAILGTIPTTLFSTATSYGCPTAVCRGVDLSAITGTLVGNSLAFYKVLLDSCRIAPGVTRLAAPAFNSFINDEIELVNCFDGINIINERYTSVGVVSTDRSIALSGGAQDDIGTYSLKLVSSSRTNKFVTPLDCFWFDTENTAIGSSKTATVEIVLAGSLNNDDVSLLLEYMGTAVGPPDQYFSNVKLLMGFNGVDASTGAPGMTDESLAARGTATVTGNAKISTAQSIFGASSLALDGAGDYITFPDSSDWVFGVGPFTIDGFFYFVAVPGPSGAVLVMQWGGGWAFYFESGSLKFRPSGGSDTNVYTWTPTLNQWHHIAFDRDVSNVARIYVNGVMVAKTTGWTPNVPDASSVLTIGSLTPGGFSGYDFNGYIKELRITPGVARYASDSGYTVPTAALPRAGGPSSVASFVSSLPAMLTAGAALPSSSVTWSGSVPTVWNPADLSGITVSGNTATGTSAGGVRSVDSVSSGKYYWETTFAVIASNSQGPGVAKSTVTLSSGSLSQVNCAGMTRLGTIFANNVNTGISLGTRNVNDVIGIALDLTNNLIYFRVAPSGNWNNSGSANPVTATGGISISSMTGSLFALYMSGGNTDAMTANFGATPFTGNVPFGFTSGLPGTPIKQKLQVTFTPQVAGRVRGLVKLGKPGTTVWVNPQIAIT